MSSRCARDASKDARLASDGARLWVTQKYAYEIECIHFVEKS